MVVHYNSLRATRYPCILTLHPTLALKSLKISSTSLIICSLLTLYHIIGIIETIVETKSLATLIYKFCSLQQ